MSKPDLTCCQTMGGDNNPPFYSYYKCGKPAKFQTPENEFGFNRPGVVCGFHRHYIDKWYEKQGSTLRCHAL